jgi:S-DNA-T family DNA segregation ATPase FtsK/SpoIIIE
MNTNLKINLGKDEYGKDLVIDLKLVKHLLIAGCTGSGKSTLHHKIITTLISNNTPNELKLILIDPKRVELPVYAHIPHLLTAVITDMRKGVLSMKWVLKEIDRRYDILKKANCKDIGEYKGEEYMPTIVIEIDEFSDLMQTYPKETEPLVVKIAQIGSSVGIHIILSTSRPSTKILTKNIRDSITTRVAFQNFDSRDSKLVIGTADALSLHGHGDMLYRDGMKYVIRAQADYVSYEDVKALSQKLHEAYKGDVVGPTSVEEYEEEFADDLYEDAKELVITTGKASTSYLQRRLGIGYSRAAQLLNALERNHIVGPANGSKPRLILVSSPFM